MLISRLESDSIIDDHLGYGGYGYGGYDYCGYGYDG